MDKSEQAGDEYERPADSGDDWERELLETFMAFQLLAEGATPTPGERLLHRLAWTVARPPKKPPGPVGRLVRRLIGRVLAIFDGIARR
ncbi:MAG: hypothetical protein Kow0069_16630 [Promethearchaeota archaeon]